MFYVIITDIWWDIMNSYMVEDDLPSFEYFRKIALTTSLRKARRGRKPSSLLMRSSTHSEEQQWPLKQTGPPPFFLSDTYHVLGHVLLPSVDKTQVLVVTVELIWLLLLNILSFKFVPTPNKSLRFRRFRRNHCQSFTAFFVWCMLFKVSTFFFDSCFSQMIESTTVEHNCCSNAVNSERCEKIWKTDERMWNSYS